MPLTPSFIHVEPNDTEQLQNAVSENTCAILLEVVQGESGVHPLTNAYLSAARKLCDDNGILLIYDEVQTGMGRTGTMFAYEHFCIEPDIFTLAKALGGGVPIGAICAKDFCCAFDRVNTAPPSEAIPLHAVRRLRCLKYLKKRGWLKTAMRWGIIL
jgi:acetylornithine aminotransferase/acetylornithine/N-succinyldiaminopimelate aminotransferase